MPHRFFIPSDWLTPTTVSLHDEIARQIRTVLRMQPGDEIIVLDNSGAEWQVKLTDIGQVKSQGQIIGRRPAQGEPALQLTLYQGALKAQKFEWVLQKGTELGVSRFTPTLCHRSIANDSHALVKKYPRWQRIIQEAAEQSRRGRLPDLAPPLPLDEAIRQAKTQHTLLVMPWEAATDASLKAVLTAKPADSIATFIGPEGGFTEAEAATARQAGAHLITLGPRILRAETAGVVICAAILYELGEWGHINN